MGGEAALATQGFGVGAQAVGAYYNAAGQRDTLKAAANIDDLNAKLAEKSAQSAILSGQREEQSVNLQTAEIKSAQKTAFAANGIDLNSTTPLSVLTSTDVVGKWKATSVAVNALNRSFGYQTQAMNATNKGLYDRAAASGINPFLSTAGSLISGAGRVAQSWYSLKKEGAFDSQYHPVIGPQNDVFARIFGQHNLVSDALY